MKYRLRPYQERAVAGVYRALKEGAKSPLLVAPTGAGKTIIAARIIEDVSRSGVRTLFVAHRSELITQCSEKLDEIGVHHGRIKAGLDPRDRNAAVQVASVQTFCARENHLRKDFGLIIHDECHHSTASTYRQVHNACGNPIEIGLTATPYRTDGTGLGTVFDRLIEVTTTADLIAEGFLVPPRIFRGDRINLARLKATKNDYDQDAAAEEMSKPKIIGDAVREYQRHAWGKRAVGFCSNVAQSKAYAEAFRHAGIPAEHLDGKTSDSERLAIYKRLTSGETLVVFNCGVWTEGFDCPSIEAVIALRPTKSRCLWRQMMGRGLRLCPEIGKTQCLVLDHACWTEEHGYVTDPDQISLDKGLGQDKPQQLSSCPQCGAQFSVRPPYCPECGTVLSQPKQMEMPDLGDGSYSLEDDGSFARLRRPRKPEPAPVPYRPEPTRISRLRRRRAV